MKKLGRRWEMLKLRYSQDFSELFKKKVRQKYCSATSIVYFFESVKLKFILTINIYSTIQTEK